MNKTSSSHVSATPQAKTSEALHKSARQLQKPDSGVVNDAHSSSPFSDQVGIDLTQVPVHPELRTKPQVQCCAKDGSPCSCPTCMEALGNEALAGDEQSPESMPGMEGVEQTSTEEVYTGESATEETSQQEGESSEAESPEAVQEESAAGLIVEDSATELSAGQMTKTQFLQRLRTEICNTIGPVLAKVGQSTEDCPYLNYWLDLYQQKDAGHIEKTAKKYAPDVAAAKSAEEYISIISQRALRAAVVWATTGKITGVPEGVSADLPKGMAQGNMVQAKAKNGGAKQTSDPSNMQRELGEGQPLAAGVRSRMESAFGMNFSHVRTHTGSTATALSNRVNARAFTVGKHVAFANGEYKPGTLLGDALIAHELAHTIQQSDSEKSIDKMEIGGTGYDALEKDADQTAVSTISSLYGSNATKSLSGIFQNAIPRLRSGLRIQRCKDNPAPTCADPGNERSVELQPVFFKDSPTDAKPTGKTWASVFAGALPIWAKLGVTFTAKSAITLEDATNKTAGSTDAELLRIMGLQTGAGIEIFFVDNDITHQGGAATAKRGNDTSQTVVSDRGTSDTLLAHELGHVLGLGHPPTDADPDTVMKPTSSHSVKNPTRNTKVNYNKITWPAAGAATCLHPDP